MFRLLELQRRLSRLEMEVYSLPDLAADIDAKLRKAWGTGEPSTEKPISLDEAIRKVWPPKLRDIKKGGTND